MSKKTTYLGISGVPIDCIEHLVTLHALLTQQTGIQPVTLSIGIHASLSSLYGNMKQATHAATQEEIASACKMVEQFPFSQIVVHYNPENGYHEQGHKESLQKIISEGVPGIQWNNFETTYSSKSFPHFQDYFGKTGALDKLRLSIFEIGRSDYSQPDSFRLRMSASVCSLNCTHLLFCPPKDGTLADESHLLFDWMETLSKKRQPQGIVLTGWKNLHDFHVAKKVQQMFMTGSRISLESGNFAYTDGVFSLEKAEDFLRAGLHFYEDIYY